MTAALTPAQMHILRHTVGWPKQYRNHFCTGPGSKDYDDCEFLVKAGLMRKSEKASWIPDEVYHVTEAGRSAISAYEK